MKAGWEVKTLGEVTSITNGGTPKSAVGEFWGGEVAWLTPKDMGKLSNHNVSSTSRTITQLGLSKCSAKLLPENSIILSTRAPIGHLAINTVPMAFNQGCRGLVPNDSLILKYLFHYLSANIDVMNDLGTGTTFKELSAGALKSLPIPLPPLEEQKRIVSILDEAFERLDRARENAEANLKSARELFESYLATIFSKKGATWSEHKLGSLCRRITVGFVGPMAHRYKDEGIPFLRSQNVRPFEISLKGIRYIDNAFNEELKQSTLLPGDVAIVRTGYPGTAAMIPESLGQANCSDIVIATPGERLMPEFLVMFLNSDFGKRLVATKSVGAAQKHFNVTAAKAVDFPTPTIEEQEYLVKTASRRREDCINLEVHYTTKLQDISDLRQSLLQKAFAGELT